MRFGVEDEDYNEAFFAEQHGFLQMEKGVGGFGIKPFVYLKIKE
jgi:hypothetical protein